MNSIADQLDIIREQISQLTGLDGYLYNFVGDNTFAIAKKGGSLQKLGNSLSIDRMDVMIIARFSDPATASAFDQKLMAYVNEPFKPFDSQADKSGIYQLFAPKGSNLIEGKCEIEDGSVQDRLHYDFTIQISAKNIAEALTRNADGTFI